jgi:hypothetical protein
MCKFLQETHFLPATCVCTSSIHPVPTQVQVPCGECSGKRILHNNERDGLPRCISVNAHFTSCKFDRVPRYATPSSPVLFTLVLLWRGESTLPKQLSHHVIL